MIVIVFFVRNDILREYQKLKGVLFQSEKIHFVQEAVAPSSEKNFVKITFLDIGQGDATFIEFPDGTQMLVDCAIDARILEALGRVMPFYDHTIDYVIATHPDKDHYGGCVDVLKRFEVKHIVTNGFKKDESPFFSVFQQAVQDENAQRIEVQQEDVWTIASTTLHFLYPDFPLEKEPVLHGLAKNKISNNTSIVFLLQYGEKKVLFTGDAETETENYLVKKYGKLLESDVLKVGHHGSNSSSGEKFLQYVSPTNAVISSGKGNEYGHPTLRIVRRLERTGATLWRTDQKGDILLTIDPHSVYVTGH